ncbi:MAG: ADP-ribose pyrophosphatase [endosymbiont of Galathealinum brachiosum]|uniref:ADP-ribose pyrophosphatase n=1 Tax=endosymbiont of Galathealinum brachiosum TaxID=2200906 RepID=A0A370DBW2_9GAMM|nr:MAG: ADP-ribose pyrophosphatase [endosymbiont of Galathealinum brachiosum]
MKLYTGLKKTVEIVLANDYVTAAVATLVIRNRQLLLGKRFNKESFEGWQCPGGYLYKGEEIEPAASRHCLQKAGIQIEQLRSASYSNNVFSEYHHTVTLYIVAEAFQVQDRKKFESEKIQWSWFDFDRLPEPLFLPLQNVLKAEWFCSLS